MSSVTNSSFLVKKENARCNLSKLDEKMLSKKRNVQQRNYIPLAHRPYVPLNQSYLCCPSAPTPLSELPETISQAINLLETDMQRKMAKENILKTRRVHLPATSEPSPDQQTVILWRGCGQRQLVRVALYGSFSTTPNKEALPPSEEKSRNQVGEKINLPEFTTFPHVAEGFGTGKFVAAFAIEARYLTRGSSSEAGFICSNDAPVTLVGWKEGRKILAENIAMQTASNRRHQARESSIESSASLSIQPPAL